MFGLITGNSSNNMQNFKYLNHDTLLWANNSLRSRLILCYIFCNTPEKLNESDFNQLKELYNNKVKIPQLCVLGLTSLISLSLIYKKRFNYTHWFPYVKYIGLPVFVNTHIFYNSESLFNKSFINNNTIGEMALKYNFGVFDFSQSKKDSAIKSLSYLINKEGIYN